MAYDEDLANHVREQLADERFTEKRMFGGLAFLLAGNMAVGVSGDGLMVRVGRDAYRDALAEPHAGVFGKAGSPMTGWVLVEAAGVAGDDGLRDWVSRGVASARALPPKG